MRDSWCFALARRLRTSAAMTSMIHATAVTLASAMLPSTAQPSAGGIAFASALAAFDTQTTVASGRPAAQQNPASAKSSAAGAQPFSAQALLPLVTERTGKATPKSGRRPNCIGCAGCQSTEDNRSGWRCCARNRCNRIGAGSCHHLAGPASACPDIDGRGPCTGCHGRDHHAPHTRHHHGGDGCECGNAGCGCAHSRHTGGIGVHCGDRAERAAYPRRRSPDRQHDQRSARCNGVASPARSGGGGSGAGPGHSDCDDPSGSAATLRRRRPRPRPRPGRRAGTHHAGERDWTGTPGPAVARR